MLYADPRVCARPISCLSLCANRCERHGLRGLMGLACCPPSARVRAHSGDVMRRFLLTIATAASALAVTSCGDVLGIGSDVTGRYELRTINGQFLPVTINDPDLGSVTFVWGEIELNSDGTFVDMYQYQTPGNPVRTDEIFGTWTRSGDRIRLQPDDPNFNDYFMDRTSSNRLIQNDAGVSLVYERF
jgi:predicted small secreted protein